MVPEDRKLAEALEQVRLALAAMGSGDPEPYIKCWAESDDATLFGAWGPIDKGFRRLAKTFRWAGTRFRSGQLVPEHSVVYSSGGLAYTVGFVIASLVSNQSASIVASRSSPSASPLSCRSCTTTSPDS